MEWRLLATVGVAILGVTSWVGAVDRRGHVPAGDFEPERIAPWVLEGSDAAAERREIVRRAGFTVPAAYEAGRPVPATSFDTADARAADEAVDGCRFLSTPPSGTSAKFDCVFDGGAVVKVKYGRNPEIHAEAAATRLLHMLGYPADTVTIVPRLRCFGCPRFPFLAMQLRSTLRLPLLADGGFGDGYTDFRWVAVERRFPAPAIETSDAKGWSWWELDGSDAPRAEIDALRLTAIFLAHWDNKAENQRLVCLDDTRPAAGATCAHPVAMLQDLGATFGPSKVNLAQWRDRPVWHDRARCIVSMRAMPFRGASFPDAQISEPGRALFAERLGAVTDAEVARLFVESRFPEFQPGSDDQHDLAAWVAAFRHRADQIVRHRCH